MPRHFRQPERKFPPLHHLQRHHTCMLRSIVRICYFRKQNHSQPRYKTRPKNSGVILGMRRIDFNIQILYIMTIKRLLAYILLTIEYCCQNFLQTKYFETIVTQIIRMVCVGWDTVQSLGLLLYF